MATLSDLRSLLDKARAHAHPTKQTHAAKVSHKRSLGATKHADGDIDIHHAFADVTRLPATKRAGVSQPRPAPLAQQTMQDERNALHAAKYGREPAPHAGEIGQVIESEQNILTIGYSTNVLSCDRC